MTGSNDSSRFGYSKIVSGVKSKRVVCLTGTLGSGPDVSGERIRSRFNRINLRDGHAKSGWRILDLSIAPIQYESNNYNQDWTVVVGFAPSTTQPVTWDTLASNTIAYAQLVFGAGALFGASSQIDDGLVIPCDIFIGSSDAVSSPEIPTGINWVMHLEKVPLSPVEYSLQCLQVLSAFGNLQGPYP